MTFLKKCSLLLLLVSLAIGLQAQDITKGSIAGVVRDASGAVIPNAKVALTSPYGDRTTTTNSQGEYSFSNLVVGDGYGLAVEASGFGTGRVQNVGVGVNKQTTQDITLQLGTTSTAVDVTAEGAPAIDVSTTTIGADLTESLYKNVPVGRNISSVIALAPGVNDGVGTGAANPSINGASGLENQYIINGANVTDPGFGGFGTYSRVFGSLGNGVNFDFIQEVQVKTGGFEAQYGQALGGIVNVLTKSGSNKYRGSVYGYFSPRGLSADFPNPNHFILNGAPIPTKITNHVGDSSIDFGADLGGHIIKDKLFWYGGFNPQYGYTYQRADPIFANSKLGLVQDKTTTINYVGKINWNISSKHQLEGSVFGDPSHTPTSFFRSLSSNNNLTESKQEYGSRTWSGRYNGALTNTWVLSANYNEYYNKFLETPLFNSYQVIDNTPSQENPNASNITSNGLGFIEASESKAHQFGVTSSHILSMLGQHTLELGYQFEDDNYGDVRRYTGPDFQLPNLPEFKDQAGRTQFGAILVRTHVNNDPTQPIVLRVRRGDTNPPTVAVDTRYHAGFVQDAWTIGRRLTIKPGLRFEQQAMTGTAFTYVFSHNWAPRIGLIFDPTGNRKSKFFASWGKFFEKIPLDIAVRSFSNEISVGGTLYRDQPLGSLNLSPANYVGNLFPQKLGFVGAGDALTQVAPGTRSQYQNEVIGGFEHEFSGGMTFSSRFVYRHLRRIIEDTSGITVTQSNLGANQQYFITNPSRATDIYHNTVNCVPNSTGCDANGFNLGGGTLGSDGVVDGFPNPSRIYKAMELVVSKRFTNNLQFYGSYRLSKLYGNYEGNFRNDNLQQDPNISSLFDFTNSDGLLNGQYLPGVLPSDRTHVIKLYGNYEFASGFMKNLNVGFGWYIQSGTPLTAYLAHPAIAYDNPGEVPDGRRGLLGRTGWTEPFDVHADYTWKMGERYRMKFLADLFNIGNQSVLQRVDQNKTLDGAGTLNNNFLGPQAFFTTSAFQTPFHARLALRFDF